MTHYFKLKLIITITTLGLLCCGCDSSDEEQTNNSNTIQNSKNNVNSPNNDDSIKKIATSQNDIIEYEKEEIPEANNNPETRFKEETASSPQQQLLSSLDKNAKVDFANLDYTITRDDTLIKTPKDIFEIEYITSCLNDSLVPQEMYDYGRSNKKSYLISHNYRTSISVKVNGRVTGQREIQKALFANQVDKEFLQKSIIKHPQFVRFDEQTNEAVFEFMIGVPNTDWLVIAGVNLNSAGTLRIIDIIAPELQ